MQPISISGASACGCVILPVIVLAIMRQKRHFYKRTTQTARCFWLFLLLFTNDLKGQRLLLATVSVCYLDFTNPALRIGICSFLHATVIPRSNANHMLILVPEVIAEPLQTHVHLTTFVASLHKDPADFAFRFRSFRPDKLGLP